MNLLLKPEILSHSYVPNSLLFRETEKAKLLSLASKGINVFVYGSIGAGKTSLIKSIVDELRLVKIVYIDGILYQTTNSILKQILYELNPLASISKSNSSLINKLKNAVKRSKLTVCIDHLDHVIQTEVVDKLLDLNISLILVSDKHDGSSRISSRAGSLMACLFPIKSYSIEQAYEILADRAKLALKPGSCGEDVLRKIARKCNGNISLGLSLLLAAVSKAEMEGKDAVSSTDIPNFVVQNGKLSDDEATLLSILREHKRLHASKLFDLYVKQAGNQRSDRAFRNYMERLVAKGLVKAIGVKRWRVYEAVDAQS